MVDVSLPKTNYDGLIDVLLEQLDNTRTELSAAKKERDKALKQLYEIKRKFQLVNSFLSDLNI